MKNINKQEFNDSKNNAKIIFLFTLSILFLILSVSCEITPQMLVLSYNRNGATIGTVPASIEAKGNSKLTIGNMTDITVSCFSFTGWNTKPDGTGIEYNSGDKITLKEDTTLYAQWKQKHDYVIYTAKKPSCTDVGWNEYKKCKDCKFSTYEEIAAIGHDIIYHPGKNPTCTDVGWDVYNTCSRCSYTTYVEKQAIGHSLVYHASKEPNCTNYGWDAYYSCSRCEYSSFKEIPAKGHDIIQHDAKEATCTNIGWETYNACSRCDYSTFVEIPATGHDMHLDRACDPNCTDVGFKEYTCMTCGLFVRDEKPALGGNHNFVNYKCTKCYVWDIGPAGGYVFYDCDADNDSGNADGLISSECGWRFLEAAPADIYNEENYDISYTYAFGLYMPDGKTEKLIGTSTVVGTGKKNTETIVDKLGDEALLNKYTKEQGNYAAKACADYKVVKDGTVYDDWFLPSKDELNLMYNVLKKNWLGGEWLLYTTHYISSSENYPGGVWIQSFANDMDGYQDTGCDGVVRPIRTFI